MKIFLFILSSLFVTNTYGKNQWESLYPHGKSAVEEINPEEVKHIAKMTNSATTTLVEFYAPWCSHCQHFAPKYEKVGEHFVGSINIRITSLDCVHYKEFCSEVKIKSYPTLKVYNLPKKSKDVSNNEEFEYLDVKEGEGYILELGSGGDKVDSILEWINKHTYSHESNGNIRNEDASLSLHEPLLPSKLLSHDKNGDISIQTKEEVNEQERWSDLYTSASHMPARLRLRDVASSLLFGLKYGVFVDGNGPLKQEQRLALGSFLSILEKAFPGPQKDRMLISQLLLKIDSGELSYDKEWENYLNHDFDLQGRGKTEEALRWSGLCDPSQRKQDEWSKASGRHISGGYTCGLWQMFHMLTMTAPLAGLSANEITGAIRTFVDHFFGCEHCRNHFLGIYDSCEYNRCYDQGVNQEENDLKSFTSNENAQLWLWKVHNAVNVRTAFEALKDEYEANKLKTKAYSQEPLIDLDPTWALWPTIKDCPKCRIKQEIEDGIEDGSGRVGGSMNRQHSIVEWDEKEVLIHLRKAYDIGLWEESKLSTMVTEAETSKKIIFSKLFSWERVMLMVVIVPIVYFWYQQRRKYQQGLHKKVLSPHPF